MPSSSSEYTTAPSSPLKRKAGRPPKNGKRSRATSPAKESSAKLSVSQAVKKYIDKDVKIVLRRCDEDNAQSDSRSSSVTGEPPLLERHNVYLPLMSPTSSIASRPPVLVKEVEYSPPRIVPHSVPLLSSEITAQPTSEILSPNHQEKTNFRIPVPGLLSPTIVHTDNQPYTATNASNDAGTYQNEVDLQVIETNELDQRNSTVVNKPNPSETYQRQQRIPDEPLTAERRAVFKNFKKSSTVAQSLPEPRPFRNVAAVLPRARSIQSQPEIRTRNNLQTSGSVRFLSQSNFKSGRGHGFTAADLEHRSNEHHVIVNQAFTSAANYPSFPDLSHWDGGVEGDTCGDRVNYLATQSPVPSVPPPLASYFSQAQESPSPPHPPSFLNSAVVAVPSQLLRQQPILHEDSDSEIDIIPVVSTSDPIQNVVSTSPRPCNDPTFVEKDDDVVEVLINSEDHCDFKDLAISAKTVFNNPPFIQPKTMWFSCVMFNTKLLRELTSHEKLQCGLFTIASIGKMLVDTVQSDMQSWPGIAQMDWQKPHMLLDIIKTNLDVCGPAGSHPCLRVQEKFFADGSAENRPPRLWDMVIDKECETLAAEMTRLVQADVKTTVMIWGARKQYYPQSWKEGVLGELLLTPTNNVNNVLSVLIFHHEELSMARGRLIHGPFPDSELWHLQDPDLGYRTQIKVEIIGKPSTTTHLTLHTMKPYIPPEGLPARCPPGPLVLFPEDGVSITEEEEQSIEDEYNNGDDDQMDGMEEEEWDDFVSVSRAGSRVESRGGSRSPDGRTYNELNECAKRLFQKPKECSISPSRINAGQNLVEGEGANYVTAMEESTVVPLNQDAVNAEQSHNNRINVELDNIEEVRRVNNDPDNRLSAPVMPDADSQLQMLLTQELVISDSESEEHQQENDKKDDLEETVLTPCDQVAGFSLPKDCQPQQSQPAKQRKHVISLSTGKRSKDKREGSKGDNSSSKMNYEGAKTAPKNHSTTERNPSPHQQREEPISFTENSEYYKFSDAIDEL